MKRIKRVALLLDASRSFDRGLLRGIAKYVNLHRPWVCLRPAAFYERLAARPERALDEVRHMAPDGIVLNGFPRHEKFLNLGIPAIDVPVTHLAPEASHILADNREAGIVAADHLAGLGLRNFAFAGYAEPLWSVERCEGFVGRLAQRNFKAQSWLTAISGAVDDKGRSEAKLLRWLKALPKPVGIMACNDEYARSLAELCRIHAVRVPDDVALLGADNDELICELCSTPLSSVTFATERAGYEAAELLDRLMDGRAGAERILVRAGNVVVRKSTDIVAIDDIEVVKALRYIRENSGRMIQVSDVVAATSLSHRTLHNRFRQAVGRSLVKELNRQRTLRIGRLLAATNESVTRIAIQFGYLDVAHLSRYFQREMGMTPREYRMRHQVQTGIREGKPAGRRPAKRHA